MTQKILIWQKFKQLVMSLMTYFILSLLSAHAFGFLDYVVTDVVCASGHPVSNFNETVSIGTVISERLTPNVNELTRFYSELNQDLHQILSDKEKIVLFTNTTRDKSHYTDGRLPCEEGEQYLAIGKPDKPIIQQ